MIGYIYGLKENSKIDGTQAGFRQGYITIYNIFKSYVYGAKYLSKKGGRFYCLFVDFSKPTCTM